MNDNQNTVNELNKFNQQSQSNSNQMSNNMNQNNNSFPGFNPFDQYKPQSRPISPNFSKEELANVEVPLQIGKEIRLEKLRIFTIFAIGVIEVIKIKNVTKSFNGLKAIENINLEIHEGDLIGLVGLLRQDSGTIEFSNDLPKIKIGFMPDQNLYSNNLNIFDLSTTAEVLSILKLDEYKKQSMNSLSAGMQKRASVASVLVSDPKIIFLDEPTANLDVDSRLEFIELLKFLQYDYDLSAFSDGYMATDTDNQAKLYIRSELDEITEEYPDGLVANLQKDIYTLNDIIETDDETSYEENEFLYNVIEEGVLLDIYSLNEEMFQTKEESEKIDIDKSALEGN
ncbi:hypothetical protein FQA39_LY12912 [Lamprigera yunnana]|nr:hypothetical protein FQA39_LY12912 [Lamprigera yunnana]